MKLPELVMDERSEVVRVLVFISHYLPGYKAGGPTRSIANLVERLGDEIQFYIVTSDRDIGDDLPYSEARDNVWRQVGKAKVKYCKKSLALPLIFRQIIDELQPSALYINSFFDSHFATLPLLLFSGSGSIKTPVLVAPRGVLGRGALSLKKTKKSLFMRLIKSLGITKNVFWQATCEDERLDIQREVGLSANIHVASNLSSPLRSLPSRKKPKLLGQARLAFLSRISPKKNLLGALEILSRQRGKVTLDIMGPVEDWHYWNKCEQVIQRMPDNISIKHIGSVVPESVVSTLSEYDAMFLPTLGENFGHAILESFAAGCPVLISDQTPWKRLLERGVGWDLPLSDWQAFHEAIADLMAMTEREHQEMRARVIRFAQESIENDADVCANRTMLLAVAGRESTGLPESFVNAA